MPGRKYASESYRYDYQGQFAEKDGETGLHSFELRQWDARIARWNSTDPYGQYFSPYMGMGNNPISLVDPDGGYTKIGAWIRNGFSSKGLDQVNGEWGFYEVDMSGSSSFNANGNFTTMDMNIQFNGSDGLSQAFDNFGSGVNNFAEATLSSLVTASTVVVMPVINQTNVILNEGPHSGSAYDNDNVVHWAVPYKIKDWRLQPLEGGKTGKKTVLNATFNTILILTPIKINTRSRVFGPLLEEGVKSTVSDVAGKAIDKIK